MNERLARKSYQKLNTMVKSRKLHQ